MPNWPTNPDWIPLSEINNGLEVTGADGFLASDQNKIISNLQFLYNHLTTQHVYAGNVSTVTGAEKTAASVLITSRVVDVPDEGGETTEVYLDFTFTIPRGTSAKFGTPTASANALNPGSNPTVSVSATGDDEHKVFDFDFGLPKAWKIQAATGTARNPNQAPQVKSQNGTDTVTFTFTLPRAAQVGTVSTTTGNANTSAQVKVTEDSVGDLNFTFTIPKGIPLYVANNVQNKMPTISTNMQLDGGLTPTDFAVGNLVMFVCYNSAAAQTYLCQGTVKTVGTNPTVTITQVTNITGQAGASYLLLIATHTEATAPAENKTFTASFSDFNRTPMAQEYFVGIYYDSDTLTTYLMTCQVTSVSGSTATCKIVSFLDAAGITSTFALQNGSYPTLGAGYLAKWGQVTSRASNTVGWHKFASVPLATLTAITGTSSYSCIVLINGINPFAGSMPLSFTGELEIDIRIDNSQFSTTPAQIKAISGYINVNNICYVKNTNSIDLYIKLSAVYDRYVFTVEDERYSGGQILNAIEFNDTYYGSTPPANAVYAVVRNNASGDANGNPLLASHAVNINGTDFNNYIQNGQYEIISSVNSGSMANMPISTSNPSADNGNWYLNVYRRGSTYITQVAYSVRSDNAVAIRSMSNGTWGAWRILSDSGVTPQAENAETAEEANALYGENIPQNTNLNTLVPPYSEHLKYYRCGSNENAESLSNCPVGVAFSLLSFAPQVTRQHFCQILTTIKNEVYYRSCDAGTWSSWDRFVRAGGTYSTLGAGYLAKNLQFSVGTAGGAWYKVAEVDVSSVWANKSNRSYSAFILLNTAHRTQASGTSLGSGLIEFDIRKITEKGVAQIDATETGTILLAGNIQADRIATSISGFTVSLYIYLAYNYEALDITVVTESNEGIRCKYITLAQSNAGSTPPANAVYAVNRNIPQKSVVLAEAPDGDTYLARVSRGSSINIPVSDDISNYTFIDILVMYQVVAKVLHIPVENPLSNWAVYDLGDSLGIGTSGELIVAYNIKRLNATTLQFELESFWQRTSDGQLITLNTTSYLNIVKVWGVR